MSNDPFKMMDLNFDPTVEQKLDKDKNPIPDKKEEEVKPVTKDVERPTFNPNGSEFTSLVSDQPILQEPVEEKEEFLVPLTKETANPVPQPVEPKPAPTPTPEPTPEPIVVAEKEEVKEVHPTIDNPSDNNLVSQNIVTTAELEEYTADKPEPSVKSGSMDKTLEFIIQNDPINAPVEESVNIGSKTEAKKAKKHRRYSHYWVFLSFLSIIFGAESIYVFASNIFEFLGAVNPDEGDPVVWDAIKFFFLTLLHFFEAFLFIFFIIFTMKRYAVNHKKYTKWWDDTEPLRIREWIKEAKTQKINLINRVNVLGLYYAPVEKETHSDHELLELLKFENSRLAEIIAKEEKRREEQSKGN